MKLIAANLDRISTVVVAGAVLPPMFQQQSIDMPRFVLWVVTAFTLHGAAHFMLNYLQEET